MEAMDIPSEKTLTKYGELVLLGYNGSLPQGNRGRMLSKYVCYQRNEPNGVKSSNHYTIQSSGNTKATPDAQRSISYTLSSNQSVIVKCKDDAEMDMFQIGRSNESSIDFVVVDTQSVQRRHKNLMSKGKKELKQMPMTISRFACRILVDRNNPSIAQIYAGAFNTNENLHLGEKAKKWQSDTDIDGLTTNGVLVMHPNGQFSSGDAECGVWRECSVGGNIFHLRGSRSEQQKTTQVHEETNILRDGTLINLGGATLLWRTIEGLKSSPSNEDLYRLVDELNVNRGHSSESKLIVIPREVDSGEYCNQPFVNLNCGHVDDQGSRNCVQEESTGEKECATCRKCGPVALLCMGVETAFYVDSGPPEYAFNPCGHMTTKATVQYWTSVDVPHGINGFQAECPFCATAILGSPGYVKLIF